VRANSIFRKLDESARASAREIIGASGEAENEHKQEIARVLEGEGGDEIWSLAVLAGRLDKAIDESAAQAEPAILARYTFNMARAFNLFYHRHRIIAEENAVRRALLVTVADITRRQLTRALATLGIEVPERM
jgi:arginyl-tRNA synthetase